MLKSCSLIRSSGAFQLEESKIRDRHALERLYLVVALALLFSTVHGMAIQIKGLRQRVDPHWKRGISYLKIGLRWLRGVLHKGRDLLKPVALISTDPQPCFASKKAKRQYYDAICLVGLMRLKVLLFSFLEMCQAVRPPSFLPQL